MIDAKVFDGCLDRALRNEDIPERKKMRVLAIADEFRRMFGQRVIRTPSELFELCDEIDRSSIAVPPEFGGIAKKIRHAMLQALLGAHYAERMTTEVSYLETGPMQAIQHEQIVAQTVASMLPALRRDAPAVFDQHWLKTRFTEEIALIERFLHNPSTGVQNWDYFASMLPASIRKRFRQDEHNTLNTGSVAQLKEYLAVARKLGPEAVTQVLISSGHAPDRNFDRCMRILTPYIGRCATQEPDFEDFIEIPHAFFILQEVRPLLANKLRNAVYRAFQEQETELRDAEGNLDIDRYEAFLASMRKRAENVLTQKVKLNASEGFDVERALFSETLEYFERLAMIETPERMRETMQTKKGPSPFPSLRQRIAMQELETKKRQLIAFEKGDGKTETAFLCKEHVGAKKILFVCIPKMEKTIAGRIASRYSPEGRDPCYKPGREPTVGIIHSKDHRTTEEELLAALEAEVVIIPASMLISSVAGMKDMPIVSFITEYCRRTGDSFDFLAIDEVHRYRKLEGRLTQAVHTLVDDIPGLYEHGHIVTLSGDPTPNKPSDIIPQLRIWQKDDYGNVKGLRKRADRTDPLVIRNALLEYLLAPDPPKDWEHHLNIREYQLSPEEANLYDTVREDESLSSAEKLRLLQLAILNPRVLSPQQEISSTLLDELTDQLSNDLRRNNAVVIAENVAKQGVSRQWRNDGDTKIVFEKVREFLEEEYGDAVELALIDGDTTDRRRAEIFARMREIAEKPNGRKIVLFAMRECIGEGIDLSFVHRAIVLEDTFNKPDLSQFVGRFVREGNADAIVTILRAADTINQGIAEHADFKYNITRALRNGGTYTRSDLDMIEAESMATGNKAESSRIALGSPLLNYLSSGQQKLDRIIGFGSKGRGASEMDRFFSEYGREFAALYCRRWEGTHGGNNSRFVAGVFEQMERAGLIAGGRYCDLGCGPLGLEQTLGMKRNGKVRRISSVDICGEMLEFGARMLEAKDAAKKSHFFAKGSMHDLAGIDGDQFGDGDFDAVNCASAFYWTKLKTKVPAKKKAEQERVRTLMEINRILKPGGIALFTFPSRRGSKEQFERFCTEALPAFGFEVLPEYSGGGSSTDLDNYGQRFQNTTVACRKTGDTDVAGIADLDLTCLEFTRTSGTVTSNGRSRNGEEPKMREGFRFSSFKLGSREFLFGADPKKDVAQRATLDAMYDGVRFLRKMYVRAGGNFGNLSHDDFNEISARDIRHVAIESGGELRHFFILPQEGQRMIDPLDEAVWGTWGSAIDGDFGPDAD